MCWDCRFLDLANFAIRKMILHAVVNAQATLIPITVTPLNVRRSYQYLCRRLQSPTLANIATLLSVSAPRVKERAGHVTNAARGLAIQMHRVSSCVPAMLQQTVRSRRSVGIVCMVSTVPHSKHVAISGEILGPMPSSLLRVPHWRHVDAVRLTKVRATNVIASPSDLRCRKR